MYCSACKVAFPDNLNFCKQCGRPLVSQPSVSASLSKCCTRCGARVVAGENFCQQCGARSRSKSEDTTIGACQQCSTPWRSAWLYCRNCGLDRDRALDLASMPSLPDQSVPTVTMEAVSAPQAVDASLHCPRCGAAATPYAQFCEVCGQSLTSDEVGPFEVEVDTEVHQTTLEVPVPSFDFEEETSFDPVPDTDRSLNRSGIEMRAEDEEEPLDPSRTTERVLSLQVPAPELEDEASAETYSTQESTPVRITELYYGDGLKALPKTPVEEVSEPEIDEVREVIDVPPPPPPPPPATRGEHHRTTSFEPKRSTSQVSSQVRMTIESKALSTGQIKELVDNDLEEEEVDYITPALGAKPSPVSASPYATAPGRSRRAAWQAGAIVVCLIALGALVAIIAWQEIGRRRTRPDSGAGGTAAASPSPSVAPAGMVFIPGGTINMGREGGDEFERPIHSVTVAPFFIDRNEVSNEEYERFITVTGRAAPSHWQDGRFRPEQARLPVVNVTWQDAAEYAKWAGKRLPTEAEWEFAARGTEGRIYPWGPLWESGRANTKEAGRGRVASVGSFPQGASQYGVLDMCGNVWEWTASELTHYGEDNRVLAPGRVIRGGAWDVARDRSTATYRGVVQPDRAYAKTGFRCVK